MTDYVIMPKADYQGACDAIRAKTGKTDLIKSGDMATEIEEIKTGGGGSTAEEKVNFYDYDGTLLHSYTVSEVQEMTELPELPTQEGLICQGWNWTLEDIKAHNRAIDVGATYITDDGKTRLYINLEEGRTDVPLYFCQNVAHGVTIDWGDGSPTETFDGNGTTNITTRHTYNGGGNYIITLDSVDGCTLQLGHWNTPYYSIFGFPTNTSYTAEKDLYSNILTKAELGKNVQMGGRATFMKCRKLACVTIPNGVSQINNNAFKGCYSLSSVVIPHGATSIGEYAFSGCYAFSRAVIPNSVTTISDYAFHQCYQLDSIVLPNSLSGRTAIGGYVFDYCNSLTSLVIPSGVLDVGMAFRYCTSLRHVEVLGATYTLREAFLGCTSLKSIKLYDGIQNIAESMFSSCKCLTEIEISNSVTGIAKSAFSGCVSLEKIEIPDSVTIINERAFYECVSLSEVILSNAITKINQYTFYNCCSLEDIEIPNSVTEIAQYAFYNCNGLVNIKIPSSVTTIGTAAFYGCSGAKVYDFTSHTSVPTMSGGAFPSIPTDCEIRVPAALYETWKTATNWSTYADKIVAV